MSGPRARALLPPDLPPGLAGDTGVVGPDSVVWRVIREKALLAGGPAALLLQVAHPLVAAGVAAHSQFEADPLRRLRGTLGTMLTVAFGDHAQVEAAVAAVAAVHVHVRGPGYRADDPELALWVHATLVHTALRSYEDFVGPLADDDKAAYYEECKIGGRLFGVTDEVMPPTYGAFAAYFQTMADEVLAVHDAARAIADSVFVAQVAGPTWLTGPVMRLAAAAILPPRLREDYGLPWGPVRQAVHAALRGTVRAGLRLTPARARYWQHYRVARSRIRPG